MYYAPPPPVKIKPSPHPQTSVLSRSQRWNMPSIGSTMEYALNNTKAIVSVLCVVTFVAITCLLLYSIKRRAIDWPVYSLRKLESPIAATTFRKEEITAPGVYGRGAFASPPILMSRPYNTNAPGDYYGVVRITSNISATLSVSSQGDYYEVVIYSYPDWTPVFSEVNITEIPFDFLEAGTYTVVVFSISPVKGEISMCKNTSRPKPFARAHRLCSEKVASLREDAITEAVSLLAPQDSIEIVRATSSPTYVWPSTVHTKIETVFTIVPDDATAIFVTVPSFGYIVEGGNEHLASIVHERAGVAIYRAVAQPPSISGGRLVEGSMDDSECRVISITAIFPNIEPESAKTGLPKLGVHVYARRDRVVTQRHAIEAA